MGTDSGEILEAILSFYNSGPHSRYYTATKRSEETAYDYMHCLNSYARKLVCRLGLVEPMLEDM